MATMANRTRPRQTELYWKWAWSISSRLGERRRAQSVYGDREKRKYPSLYRLGTLAQTSGNKQNTGGDVDKAVGKENRESHDELLGILDRESLQPKYPFQNRDLYGEQSSRDRCAAQWTP